MYNGPWVLAFIEAILSVSRYSLGKNCGKKKKVKVFSQRKYLGRKVFVDEKLNKIFGQKILGHKII